MAAALRLAGFVVIVLQPMQVRCLAGFELWRAKNDRIDSVLVTKAAVEATQKMDQIANQR